MNDFNCRTREIIHSRFSYSLADLVTKTPQDLKVHPATFAVAEIILKVTPSETLYYSTGI